MALKNEVTIKNSDLSLIFMGISQFEMQSALQLVNSEDSSNLLISYTYVY